MKQDEQAVPPPSQFRSLGELLRWHRLHLGLSQEALAEAIGASTRSIRRWEQDLALPQEIFRERLGQLLELDLYSFSTFLPHLQPLLRSSALPARITGLLATSSQGRIPLLESKLRPPQAPAILVERERLLQRLDAVRQHRLSVLCAAAGWGKTTLLSAWATRFPHAVAWVSLDELDNEAIRFWTLLMTALDTRLPFVGQTALALLHSPQPPALTTVLSMLIERIEDTTPTSEIILVLDDYQLIEDPSIHEGMLFLLEHLPASLHLLLSSRIEPALPLSRWRLMGQVLELHDAELRFTQEETSRFLKETMDCSIDQEEVQLLQEHTEGWIAGLQLAALALQGRQDPSGFLKSFRGSHRLLLDYVQEEILQRQPLPMQRFLLQTAVLNQMNAALCQAVTGEQASQQRLEALERAHLFVVALDEERHWYRFHSLFREALLACLSARQPEQISGLHQRAAHWHEQQGNMHEAMAHTLAGADYDFAASLIEREASRLWQNGEAHTVHTWVLALPDRILRAHARLALTAALHLLLQTRYIPPAQRAEAQVQAGQTIARIDHILQNQGGIAALPGAEAPLPEAEERLLHQRICLLHGLGATKEAYLKGNGAHYLITQNMQVDALDDDVTWMMIPTTTLITSFAFQGDVTAVLSRMLEMKRRACQEQDRFALIGTTFWVATAYLFSGQLRLAHQECLQALEIWKQEGEQMPIVGYLYLALATFHWTQNQLEEAHTYLHIAMYYARLWQNMDLRILTYYWAVQVWLAAGENAGAEQILEEIERLAQQNGFAVHRPRITATRVQLWLAQGNLSAAAAWAAHYKFTPDALEYICEHEYFMLARVYLEQRRYKEAQQVLALLLSRAQRDQRGWDVIPLLALQVVALQGLGETALARQVTVRLLAQTEPEGYLRVYLDASEPMRQALQSLLEAQRGPDQASRVSSLVMSYVARLATTIAKEADTASQRSLWFSSLIDSSVTE